MPPLAPPQLVSDLYEAAAFGELWPLALNSVARHVGALGSMSFVLSPGGRQWTASPSMDAIVAEYERLGFFDDPTRTAPLMAEMHPGFRCELDYRSIEEIEALHCYREFFTPRKVVGGVGTILQGIEHDALFFTVEGLGGHHQAKSAVPMLDALRPHLGRALTLAAKVKTLRASAVIDGLAAINVAAAAIRADGRIRAMNAPFEQRLGLLAVDPHGKLRFLSPRLNADFLAALAQRGDCAAAARSIAVSTKDAEHPFVLHLLPMPGRSRDLFEADGILLIAADGANRSLPNADLLRMLFDLTPAEARLARALLGGHSIAEAAARQGVREGTARVQLRGVFAKTGVSRQSELIRLLSGFAL